MLASLVFLLPATTVLEPCARVYYFPACFGFFCCPGAPMFTCAVCVSWVRSCWLSGLNAYHQQATGVVHIATLDHVICLKSLLVFALDCILLVDLVFDQPLALMKNVFSAFT